MACSTVKCVIYSWLESREEKNYLKANKLTLRPNATKCIKAINTQWINYSNIVISLFCGMEMQFCFACRACRKLCCLQEWESIIAFEAWQGSRLDVKTEVKTKLYRYCNGGECVKWVTMGNSIEVTNFIDLNGFKVFQKIQEHQKWIFWLIVAKSPNSPHYYWASKPSATSSITFYIREMKLLLLMNQFPFQQVARRWLSLD